MICWLNQWSLCHEDKTQATKKLKTTERHKEWPRKNLPKTKMEKENQKQIFKVRTAIQFD